MTSSTFPRKWKSRGAARKESEWTRDGQSGVKYKYTKIIVVFLQAELRMST